MPDKVLTSLNWLDLVMIIVVASAIFRGAVQGFVVELFKILGVFVSTVFSLHFYVRAADYLKNSLAVPSKLGEIFSFVIISIFIILLFRLVGQGWLLILKVDAKAGFSPWGGGLLALISSLMICGLLFFGMLLIGNQTIAKFAKNSFSGHYLLDLSPKVYTATYDGLIVPFFPDEVFNQKVPETIEKEPVSK